MNESTKNSSKEPLELTSEKNPVSVYSANFTRVINNTNREMVRTNSAKTTAKSSFSKIMSKWQNALAVAAILTVAVLQFVFQISFVQPETVKNLRVDAPSVKIEQVPQENLEIKSVGFEAKKINDAMPKIVPTVKQRRPEIVPPKPQPKQKNAAEIRAERLRRAEKILTGL